MSFTHFQLLRRIGQFDHITPGSQLPFKNLTLIYGENGRGKSTLASIFRSLELSKPNLITERQRLGTTQPIHLVLNHATGSLVFQNGTWSSPTAPVAVYDDTFVAENVCSGIEIQARHRENLHELILGAQGVSLKNALQGFVSQIEDHNRNLRAKGDAVSLTERRGLTVDDFCSLTSNPTVEREIEEAYRKVEAARSAEAIRNRAVFSPLDLPTFDTSAINALLSRSLPNISAEAAREVQAHFSRLGRAGEAWVRDGIHYIRAASEGRENKVCPFCVQRLDSAPLIRHYQAYFDAAYIALKREVDGLITALTNAHRAENHATFERKVRLTIEDRQFWSSFASLPEVEIDSEGLGEKWRAAREHILEHLRTKQSSPLEAHHLSLESVTAIDEYHAARTQVVRVSDDFLALNSTLTTIKAQAAAGNSANLTIDLNRLKAVRARHTAPVAALCAAYLAEKEAKVATEGHRTAARTALEAYSTRIFSESQAVINAYLQRFNAGFKLDSVEPVNNRGGTSCAYNVLINNHSVSLTAATGPSFRTTLSAGDRNTLALAFFFSALDANPQLSQMTVVIDDPMTSLDEHRSLTTVEEIRRLAGRVAQVIVLSHSKPFLCALWEETTANDRAAMQILRVGTGSDIAAWDVHQDCVTEHDRRHELIRGYLDASNPAMARGVATALRPALEAFMRVAYPEYFPPGQLLGPFIGICRPKIGQSDEILNLADTDELRELLNYGNKFHHDTNSAWATEVVNDQELLGFCRRTLAFCKR